MPFLSGNFIRRIFTLSLLFFMTACAASSSSRVSAPLVTEALKVFPLGKSAKSREQALLLVQTPEQSLSITQSQTNAKPDPWQLATDKAIAAVNIAQSAQSEEDWLLVANRWEHAIVLMQAVAVSHPKYPQARSKIVEYQRNLSAAEQRASQAALEAVTSPAPVQSAN
ncbi:MAG: hypothetical protein F6K19_22050 [Cyanothece sp. SIO1E1]|nr:hypothetical protein [Cyanothece sp. SIO1E1]